MRDLISLFSSLHIGGGLYSIMFIKYYIITGRGKGTIKQREIKTRKKQKGKKKQIETKTRKN